MECADNPSMVCLDSWFDMRIDMSVLRTLVNDRNVKYLHIPPTIYDVRNLPAIKPNEFLARDKILLPLPMGWSGGRVERVDGVLRVVQVQMNPLPGSPTVPWHPTTVDEMTLRVSPGDPRPDRHSYLAHAPPLDGAHKFRVRRAVRDHEVHDMIRESKTRRFLTRTRVPVAPFLGHVRAGRGGDIFGFATAWLPGYSSARRADLRDYGACRGVLELLHKMSHGVGVFSPTTFVVGPNGVFLQDLSRACLAGRTRAAWEMANLKHALAGDFNVIPEYDGPSINSDESSSSSDTGSTPSDWDESG